MNAPFPTTAGELLLAIESAGETNNWVVSSDPADARDQHGSLRRTFRLRALGDAECALVCEFGAVFIVLDGARFDCLLQDLWRPNRLRDVIASKSWAGTDELAFIDALERAFPRELFAPIAG
ncbi:hypothetical protein [Cupriavidus sp. AcVe19-1a]|uniref:hypothetical protein n=1 Tax=Cupriavidus sp. AcVe19-1a TaxID=2821359 RepID=UPI001AE1A57C|nr:hypothetical protein [Cupriavidus sp. AcVe19-1a]MBP0627733.1 hypothetical protein [Cupriavidus sp. AcVe19-1a]